jgi:hypothetical protein
MAQVEIRIQKTLWGESLALGRLNLVLPPQGLQVNGYENETAAAVGGNRWGVLGAKSH